MELVFKALNRATFQDLESLFGKNGACGGCWCMHWRLSRSEFVAGKGRPNRDALWEIANEDAPVGILAYSNEQPIGWCAVAPRIMYPTLQRSRVLAPFDEEPVWSIVCLYVGKQWRNQRVGTFLIQAAVQYATTQGATVIEAYPSDLGEGRLPDPFVFTGLHTMFLVAGFTEVLRRSPKRPIMRYIQSQQ